MKRTEFWDEYDHEDDEVEYICENIPYTSSVRGKTKDNELEQLFTDFNSTLDNSCSCKSCDSCHGGINYSTASEVVLSPNRPCHDLIYECSTQCSCREDCSNRLVQFGPRKGLKIKEFPLKEKGLITEKEIPKGAFICEYAGEILTPSEAKKRDQDSKMNYILCLNEMSSTEATLIKTFIDPRRQGNIGRYLNHSCDPNCEIISVRVSCPIPKIAIFAKRNISEGEELCFHYAGSGECSFDEDKKPCFCYSSKCTGFLPNLKF